MCIAHGHSQAGVTKNFLQGKNVAAVLDEVAGEGMAQRMGGLPCGSLIEVLATARLNEVMDELGCPCCFQ